MEVLPDLFDGGDKENKHQRQDRAPSSGGGEVRDLLEAANDQEIYIPIPLSSIFRSSVVEGSTKKRIFYGQADCKGEGRGGLAPSAFGKCENFDPEKNEFFAPNGQHSVWRRCSRAKNLFLFSMVQKSPDRPKRVVNGR